MLFATRKGNKKKTFILLVSLVQEGPLPPAALLASAAFSLAYKAKVRKSADRLRKDRR